MSNKVVVYDEIEGDTEKKIDTDKMIFLTSQLKTVDDERLLGGRWSSLYKQKRTGLYWLVHTTMWANEKCWAENISRERALEIFRELSSKDETFRD